MDHESIQNKLEYSKLLINVNDTLNTNILSELNFQIYNSEIMGTDVLVLIADILIVLVILGTFALIISKLCINKNTRYTEEEYKILIKKGNSCENQSTIKQSQMRSLSLRLRGNFF